MAITVTTFPITFSDNTYFNIFKSFVENNIILDVGDVSAFDQYRIEYRFAAFTTQGDQSATNLLPNAELEYYPDENNLVRIDVSLLSDIFEPAFPAEDGVYNSQFQAFQVQYRIKYLLNSVEVVGSWVSAYDSALAEFVAFIIIHAGGDSSPYSNVYQILNNTKSIYKNQLNDILLISSLANEDDDIDLTLKYLTRAKALYIAENRTLAAFDGAYAIKPNDNHLNDNNARYLAIYQDAILLSSHVIHDTSDSENEFILRWLGIDGDVKSWLFTKKAELRTQVRHNFSERTFRGIPSSIEETFILETDGLSKVEHDFIRDINMSNLISFTRNSETFNCIIDNPSWGEDTYNNTYSFQIDVIKKEQYLMKV